MDVSLLFSTLGQRDRGTDHAYTIDYFLEIKGQSWAMIGEVLDTLALGTVRVRMVDDENLVSKVSIASSLETNCVDKCVIIGVGVANAGSIRNTIHHDVNLTKHYQNR